MNEVEKDKDRDYKYLITSFKEQTIKDRFNHLEQRAKEFINRKNYSEKVFLNKLILDAVVIDYFVDIDRLKKFQEIDHANKNKITAYTAYWWLRRKPLQLLVDKGKNNENLEENEELVYINESFITSLIMKDIMYMNEEEILNNNVLKNGIKHIFYYLKYRPLNAQAIELMLVMAQIGEEIGKIKKHNNEKYLLEEEDTDC